MDWSERKIFTGKVGLLKVYIYNIHYIYIFIIYILYILYYILYIILYICITLYYITLHYIILYYIILCYIILFYTIILYYTILLLYIYKPSAQVFPVSGAVYNRCLGDRCTMACFLLVWLLHQKGIGCHSASPDAIWFGHHGYSQSCEGCDHKQRCSTGSPRTSHCLSRFQCLDYWLACLAPGR